VKIAVTGATGFLGAALLRDLAERGHTVRAILRPTSRREALPTTVEVRVADPASAAEMCGALTGAEALIHAAALVSNWGHRWVEFRRANVEAPVVACRAAADAGIRRIVYVSSFLALGPSDPPGIGTPVNESPPRRRRRFHNHYERSKTLGDACICELAGQGLPVVTVYPGVLYGPDPRSEGTAGGPENGVRPPRKDITGSDPILPPPGPRSESNFVARLVDDLAAGRLTAIVGSGRQRWSLAHVEDVAAGIRAALTVAGPRSRYVLGGENLEMSDLLARLAASVGVAPPRRHVSPRLAWLAAALTEARARLAGGIPTFTRDALAILTHDWACDSSAARRDLGYNPRPFCVQA
jgi:nucleoside-diphosphate-sugar epimerase